MFFAWDFLVPWAVIPTLFRMPLFGDWASAGHRHCDRLRIFLLSFGKMFDHQRLMARFTWTGGPWWTMQCHIGTRQWSIRKRPLLSLLLQVLFRIGWCSLMFVGEKHPQHPATKTIAASNAGTWKWKQP